MSWLCRHILGPGQYHNAVASGRVAIAGPDASRYPTLPHYGTDPISQRFPTFEAKRHERFFD